MADSAMMSGDMQDGRVGGRTATRAFIQAFGGTDSKLA